MPLDAMPSEADKKTCVGLRKSLEKALIEAESASEEVRAATLRLVMCAVRDRDAAARKKDECRGCEETDIADILKKMATQREESAAEYDAAGRIELAEQEREELEVIRGFLPKPMGCDEIRLAAEQVVADLDATGLKDVGKCIGELKARYPGRVESGAASAVVKQLLL